jgi:RNA recognition motif-containing protein
MRRQRNGYAAAPKLIDIDDADEGFIVQAPKNAGTRRVVQKNGALWTKKAFGAPMNNANSNMFDDRLARYQDFMDSNIRAKLAAFRGQSMKSLPDLDRTEKKFSGRSHLYVGGIASKTTEKELKEWFGEFGEVGDVYLKSDKYFAFVRMGTRYEAEKAKTALDGQTKNGKTLKIKFSVHQAAIKVSNLGPWVSNELLHAAFSAFGEIERCLVFSDEKGRTKEEGIIEFAKKGVAMEAVRRCTEGCFFLCTSLRPVYAELISHAEDEDGFPEKSLPKQNSEYNLERETAPRFANQGTFEYEYGMKWKALYTLRKQKEEALNVEMKLEEAKLIAQMEYSRFEHETDMLREELRKKEAVRDQHRSMWSVKEKYMEDIMKQEQEKQRALEDGIFNRNQNKPDHKEEVQEVDLTSDHVDGSSNAKDEIKDEGQETSVITQAQNLSNVLDLQNCLLGMGQNTSLPDQETLQTLNTLLNLQQMSQFANLGESYVDAEDLHMQGEMENKRKKRKH